MLMVERNHLLIYTFVIEPILSFKDFARYYHRLRQDLTYRFAVDSYHLLHIFANFATLGLLAARIY
jgi:hypothetical protein